MLRHKILIGFRGGSTEEATLKGCIKAVDIMANYLDGKGASNRVA
jgi:hypothetical protein